MPYLLDTPEGWFRTRHCDLHELVYDVPEDLWKRSKRKRDFYQRQYREDSKKLRWWLKKFLPHVEHLTLGSSEYSGYILGGPTMRVVDFDAESRQRFEALWAGRQPWRIEVHAYAEWAAKIASVRISDAPGVPDAPCLWWDTPSGFVLMSAYDSKRLLSFYDAEWLLRQQRPDIGLVEDECFPRGRFLPPGQTSGNHALIIAGYGPVTRENAWLGRKYIADKSRVRALKQALGLKDGQKVRIDYDDF